VNRIPPSVKLKQEVEAVLQGWETKGHPLDMLVRLGARHVLQVAVEREVEEFLGRAYYRRGARNRQGWRNGYEPVRVRSAEGMLEVLIPRVRESEEPFRSQLSPLYREGSDALGRMVKAMYIRGLSTRDVEDIFLEVMGHQVLSRSGVSRVASQLQADFDNWRKRDLSGLKVVYLFLDAIYLPLRQGTEEKEGVLCAYGILEDGKKVLLHLALGSRESYEAWLAFLHDMVGRGLREPLLVVSDKHKALRRAVREVFPHALKQPCLAHKMRNILCKLPRKAQKEMKALLHQVYRASSYQEGLRLGRELIARFRGLYPSAMECLGEDLEECLTYLKFPQAHWKAIRTTNLLERLFGEGRRRTKVIPRFPTESSGLRLVYASLLTASQRWKGAKMTPDIWWELEVLRREAFGESKAGIDRELVAA